MAFELRVKNQIIEIKFNYRLMFEVQRRISTKNKETGDSNNDGVGSLFLKILNQEDEGIFDLVDLVKKKNDKYTESDVMQGIEDYILEFDDVEDGYDAIFKEIQEEMVESGFFKKKILKYIDTMKQSAEIMENKEKRTQDETMAVDYIKRQITKLEEAMSLETVQD